MASAYCQSHKGKESASQTLEIKENEIMSQCGRGWGCLHSFIEWLSICFYMWWHASTAVLRHEHILYILTQNYVLCVCACARERACMRAQRKGWSFSFFARVRGRGSHYFHNDKNLCSLVFFLVCLSFSFLFYILCFCINMQLDILFVCM